MSGLEERDFGWKQTSWKEHRLQQHRQFQKRTFSEKLQWLEEMEAATEWLKPKPAKNKS